jgi:PAS domain S-box-containing protein
LKITKKDRTEFYGQLESYPVKDEAGNYSIIRTSLSDITERKQAALALTATKQEVESIVKTVPDIIYRLDPQGRLTFVSDSVKRYGYEPKELLGTNVIKLVYPEDREKTIHKIKERRTGDRSTKSFETKFLTKNQMPVSFEVFIISAEGLYSSSEAGLGDFLGTQGIARDISARKQAEEALRQSQEKIARLQKMESLGLLAGGVAHDLNNVLSGIVSYPELLLLDLPEDSRLRGPIETMKKSGQRAVAIVQDLLTVARGVATMKEPLNLNDLIREYLQSPEFHKFKEYHPAVTIRTNLDNDLLNIAGSLVHIRKVAMNLVSNAVEAIEGSGNVTISTVNRYVDKTLKGYDDVKTGEYAVLAVSDGGSGISSKDLKRIFEPFYTKKVMGRSGTGLGLAVVWNVVQDHQGYIDVQSSKNDTTFEIYFPITREAILDKESDIPIGDYKGAGETILVVDDVDTQREIACNMLNTLGYKAKAVSSGEEAVNYLQEHAVDLILLDMIMDPGISGRETYERVTKIHPNQKAVIVSGFVETDEVREAQRLGAGRFIKKPFTLEKIGFALKNELKR